jgi:hypothetical protein
MPVLNSTAIAGALINAFERLPELTEPEKGIIIHEIAVMLQETGWAFDENEFADKILNPRGVLK